MAMLRRRLIRGVLCVVCMTAAATAVFSADVSAKVSTMKDRFLIQTLPQAVAGKVAFSPDARKVAFIVNAGEKGGWKNTLHVCRVITGACSQPKITDPKGFKTAPVFSPNGKFLAASTAHPHRVFLWRTEDLELVRTFKLKRYFQSMAFSPDGSLLAVGNYSGTVDLFDPQRGVLVRTLEASYVGIGITHSSKHKVVAVESRSPAAKAGIKTGGTIKTVAGKSVRNLTSKEASSLMRGREGSTLRLEVEYKVGKSKLKTRKFKVRRGKIKEGKVYPVVFSKDGKSVAGGLPQGYRIWPVSGGESRMVRIGFRPMEILPGGTAFRFSDSQVFRSTDWGRDPSKAIRLCAIGKSCTPRSVTLSPDGTYLASLNDIWAGKGGQRGLYLQLRFHSMEGGEPFLWEGIAGKRVYRTDVVFSPDKTLLAVPKQGQPMEIYRNPMTPLRYVAKDHSKLTSSTGKILTRLPAGTLLEISRHTPKYAFVHFGGLKGFVKTEDLSYKKPDLIKPVIRVTEKSFNAPVLTVKGVVYDDIAVKTVRIGGKDVPRSKLSVALGNYGDAYPFSAEMMMGPDTPRSIHAADASGKTVEIPINIEEREVDYAPRYVRIEIKTACSALSAPAAGSRKVSSLSAKTVLAALGEKEGWYYLEGGTWLAKANAHELGTAPGTSDTVSLSAKKRGVSAPKVLSAPSDVDAGIPPAASPLPDAVAVVIGIKDYKNSDVPTVEYALNDARTVREYLTKGFGVPAGNVIFLENPTQGDFSRVFGTRENPRGQLHDYVKPGRSDVFVYYSGHGAPDMKSNSSYFVPADAHPDYVRLNGYPLEQFYRNLSALPARSVTVVLDSCFSGSSHKGMLLKNASPLVLTVKEPVVPKGLNVFTSASGDEISSWHPEKRHSLFTYHFLKAVKGMLLKDRSSVTFGALKAHLSEHVPYEARRMFGRSQNPTFTGDADKNLLIR